MGFEFRETMAGSFHLTQDPSDERPMSFTIRARSGRLRDFIRRPEVEIEGEVDAEGFADHRRLRGTLLIDFLRTHTLQYAFGFHANDGRPYAFEGKKTIHAGDLVESMTVLPGAIVGEDGTAAGRALLRFDLRSDLIRFLRTFRVAR